MPLTTTLDAAAAAGHASRRSMTPPAMASSVLDAFLEPLRVYFDRCHKLSRLFLDNFAHLAAESRDQFLATPISESILCPVARHGQGRYAVEPPPRLPLSTMTPTLTSLPSHLAIDM